MKIPSIVYVSTCLVIVLTIATLSIGGPENSHSETLKSPTGADSWEASGITSGSLLNDTMSAEKLAPYGSSDVNDIAIRSGCIYQNILPRLEEIATDLEKNQLYTEADGVRAVYLKLRAEAHAVPWRVETPKPAEQQFYFSLGYSR